MTTQELSVAAAEDEVAYHQAAIERLDRKLEKLKAQTDQTKAARGEFVAGLKAAKDELKAAKARGTEAAAGAANGEGNA